MMEMRVSVYKLGMTGVGIIDQIGSSLVGAYHSSVVLFGQEFLVGQEYAFAGHDDEGETGIYRSTPERDPNYTFYQRVLMGQIKCTPAEAMHTINQLAGRWPGTDYDIVDRNCNHFASDLCWSLAKRRPPAWINETANGLAASRRRNAAEAAATEKALVAYRAAHAVTSTSLLKENEEGLAPGERAFKSTFTATFGLAWKRGRESAKGILENCPEDVDPLVLQRQVERTVGDAALKAGSAAAEFVARAARAAARARKPWDVAGGESGLAAWDHAWQRESGPLLKAWREAALFDELAACDDQVREKQVQTAIAAADRDAQAAQKATSSGRAQRLPICGATAEAQREECTGNGELDTRLCEEAQVPGNADDEWDAKCSHQLGAGDDLSKVRMLPRALTTSITRAAELLNANEVSCPDGICIVYSESRCAHFVLYRHDMKKAVQALYGIAD